MANKVWYLSYKSPHTNSIEVYQTFECANREYEMLLKSLEKEGALLKQSLPWEFAEFRFKRTTLWYRDNLVEILLQETILRS
jgi:hypothetical protein